jgi:eukaryotic-like serine/threonine-protein kinase
MGEVYHARDSRLDRTVAVKVLRSGVATDETHRQRFLREARATAAFSHPGIAAFYDAGEGGIRFNPFPQVSVIHVFSGNPLCFC